MHKESGSLKVKGQPTTLKSLPSSKNARRMSTQFFTVFAKGAERMGHAATVFRAFFGTTEVVP
jgi:hypothetical protein